MQEKKAKNASHSLREDNSLYAAQGTKACPSKAARISPSGNGINPMESSICSTLSSPRRVGVVSGQTGYSFILFQN